MIYFNYHHYFHNGFAKALISKSELAFLSFCMRFFLNLILKDTATKITVVHFVIGWPGLEENFNRLQWWCYLFIFIYHLSAIIETITAYSLMGGGATMHNRLARGLILWTFVTDFSLNLHVICLCARPCTFNVVCNWKLLVFYEKYHFCNKYWAWAVCLMPIKRHSILKLLDVTLELW